MFEVEKRAGLGRTGKWKLCEWVIRTPNILFVDNKRFPAPKFAEVLLIDVGSEISDGKPYLRNNGSFFFSNKSIGDIGLIPSDIHYPFIYSEEVGERDTRIIQIVRRKTTIDKKAELFIMANAAEIIPHPKELAVRLTELRENIGYGKLIYMPGVGTPEHIATLVYCGVDIFDTIQLILYARMGFYLFANGKIHKDDLKEIPCHCPACNSPDLNREFKDIVSHNFYSAIAELRNVRNSIEKGCLRELVEYRSRANPEMTALLRYFDLEYFDSQEKYLPVTGGGIFACGKDALNRPDVERFRRRIVERWRKSPLTRILLLLPCSARKPYSDSLTHKAFKRAIIDSGNPCIVQEVILTSPLGIVPRELERFYPAKSYDIPVTGHWDKDEIHMLSVLIGWLFSSNQFDRVILNIPSEMQFIKDAVKGFDADYIDICSGDERPSDNFCIEKLASVLREVCNKSLKIRPAERLMDDLLSMARFQFGKTGESLVEGTEVRGRYPYVRLFKDGRQIASFSPDRDMFALTPEGGEVFLKEGAFLVTIDDFEPKGDIMAVGVLGADPMIRPSDEVIITNRAGTRVVGTGIARMSSSEMLSGGRGVAVKTRQFVGAA